MPPYVIGKQDLASVTAAMLDGVRASSAPELRRR
jgi:hypothetical protein